MRMARTVLAPLARWWIVPATLALTFVSWPAQSLETTAVGTDPSWRLGLHLAAHGGLDHGRDFSFTYGPLGFTTAPYLYFASTAALAVAFTVAAQFVLVGSLLYASTRVVHPLVAVTATYFVASAPIPRSEVPTLIVFSWAVMLGLRRLPLRAEVWAGAGIGATVAVALNTKFNAGLTAVGVAVLAVLLARRRGTVAISATLAFVTSVAVAWTATGSAVRGLPQWLLDSTRLASGYSESLSRTVPGMAWTLYAALGLLAWLAYAGWSCSDGELRKRRVLLLAMIGGFGFAYFKSGFSRPGGGHEFAFFAAAAVASLALTNHRIRVGSIAATLSAVAAMFALADVPPDRLFVSGSQYDPQGSLAALRRTVSTLASNERRSRTIAREREAMRAQLMLGDNVRAAISNRPTLVYPSEISVVWAYGLRWRPLRSLQAYAGYAADLDNRNAASLLADARPTRVLDHLPASRYESPAAYYALACAYGEIASSASWQLLAPANRTCAPPRLIKSLTVASGALVQVPEAPNVDDVVFARFTLPATSLGTRLRTILYRSPTPVSLHVNEQPVPFFFPGTAAHPHVMRIPRSLGFSAPFGANADAATIRVYAVPGPVEIRFYAAALEATRSQQK
jgi:hypothetical protein